MRDKPGGAELLKLARRILRQQLLQHIPPEDKYSALMVANAMVIAARQMEFGDAIERQELDRVAQITGEETQGDDVQSSLQDCYRRLSRDIRAGDVVPATAHYDAIYELLYDQAKQKVLESNPGYLKE
jgi:hypothetical protein